MWIALLLPPPVLNCACRGSTQLSHAPCAAPPTALPPQKAAAIDPHNVAAQAGPEGEAAAQVRSNAVAWGKPGVKPLLNWVLIGARLHLDATIPSSLTFHPPLPP